ncbi:hypothetical protein [Macellibacteroides fermentans]|uniref:hypothetical protein n=1 Tax=Macellibacteroides fermentans TaxID=879969 RepID=UPI00406C9241
MIAKNIKGKSFKGCVSYVMHEGATLLEAEGVWPKANRILSEVLPCNAPAGKK